MSANGKKIRNRVMKVTLLNSVETRGWHQRKPASYAFDVCLTQDLAARGRDATPRQWYFVSDLVTITS
jgi:hypothetical protein